MSFTCLPMLARTRACAALRASSPCAARKRRQGFQRNFPSIASSPRIAGQANDAVGPGAVREGELEVEGARRQAVAHDRLHPPLAEGAARLLVSEDALEGNDFARHFGQPRLGGVDHRQPLVELAEIVAGPLALVGGPAPSHSAMPERRPPSSALDCASAAKRASIASCRSSAMSRSRRCAAAARISATRVKEQQKRQRGEGRSKRFGEVDRHARRSRRWGAAVMALFARRKSSNK